ncbi:energy transducer TonB [Hymenobacter jeollabukensis]|nr:energy transducer TonB [Hymenobacter jeollabukensis]
MTKIIGLLALLGIATTGYGQQTRKVTKRQTGYREQYSVLTADPKIKHGPYASYLSMSGRLAESGYYRNGVRDSVWTEYFWDGKHVLARGRYRNDQKVGVWEAFDYEGKPTQQYDYTRRQLLFNKPGKGEERMTARALSPGVALDAKPVYISGNEGIMQVIGMNVRYPAAALRSQISGEVRVAFTIDAEGKTADYRVAKGIGYGCDEEALKAVKLIPANWVPAQAAGRPVAAEVELPVTFTIQ